MPFRTNRQPRLGAPARALALGCLGASLAVMALVATPLSAQEEDRRTEEVRTREIAFAQTMADRDFDAFQSFLAEETIFFDGDTPIRGSDAVAAAWAPFFEGPTPPFSWHPEVVEVLESGTLALNSGPVRTPAGEIVGRFNSVWRLESDGQWRIVFDKGCQVAGPPPAASPASVRAERHRSPTTPEPATAPARGGD